MTRRPGDLYGIVQDALDGKPRRKKALRRKAPLARKKPAKKASTLKPATKPMRAKKPGVAAAQYAQRRALAIRSGGRCEAEFLINPHSSGFSNTAILERYGQRAHWVRCTSRATVAAHIYQRPRCGQARDLVDVVIHTCTAHNVDHLTDNTKNVRAPLRFAVAAWEKILACSTLGIDEEDRFRIHVGSIGERPQAGVGMYA